MAEFYIAPEYRRAGVGRKVVTELLSDNDGIWFVRVMQKNHAGLSFWRSVLQHPLVVNLEEKCSTDGFEFKFVSFGGSDV